MKRVSIFFFSLTGTTRYVAEVIADEFRKDERTFAEPRVIDLLEPLRDGVATAAATLGPDFATADVIAIGSLVWAAIEGPGIRDLIAALPADSIAGKPVVIFWTGGGGVLPRSGRLRWELAGKGAHVIGEMVVKTGCSNWLPAARIAKVIPERVFEEARQEARRLVGEIATWKRPESPPVQVGNREEMDGHGATATMMTPVIVERARCIRCLVCVRGCPVRAITVEEVEESHRRGFPVVDKGRCIQCGRCTNRCPTKAIRPAGIPPTWAGYNFTVDLIKPDAVVGRRGGLWSIVFTSVLPAICFMHPKKSIAVGSVIAASVIGVSAMIIKFIF